MFQNNEKLQTLAEISLLANKWAMWADTCLPKHKAYVPAAYQARDAYYHIIKAISKGLDENGALLSENLQVIGDFWATDENVSKQLTEALHHISRAFFDTVDYVFIELLKKMDQVDNFRNYLSLDQSMQKYIKAIHKLREQKAETEQSALNTVRKWDYILSIITDIYFITDDFAGLWPAVKGTYKAFMAIELRYSQETITEHFPNYFDLKKQFVSVVNQYEKDERGKTLLDIVDAIAARATYEIDEEIIKECDLRKQTIIEECQNRQNELEQIIDEIHINDNALYSYELLNGVKAKTNWLKGVTSTAIELCITAIPTYLLDNYLFPQDAVLNCNSIIGYLSSIDWNVLRFLGIYAIVLILIHFALKYILIGSAKVRVAIRFSKVKKNMGSDRAWKKWKKRITTNESSQH